MKILLVEDDETIAKGLSYSFRLHGYEPLHAASAREASRLLSEAGHSVPREKIGLIILDVALPDGNGFSLYEKTIQSLQIPTLFLTARDDEDDIVRGLELGAEDYMTKPFSTKELMARVRRIVLREKKNLILTVKDISFDMDKMLVCKGEEKIELTSLELKILQLLFLNLNKVVRRSAIIDKIWEWTGNDVNDNTVTVYLKRIREKLGSNIILTIKGIGYRIDEDES